MWKNRAHAWGPGEGLTYDWRFCGGSAEGSVWLRATVPERAKKIAAIFKGAFIDRFECKRLTVIIQRAVRILKGADSPPKLFHISRLRPLAPLGQHPNYPPPTTWPIQIASQVQPFVYQGMQIHHATRLMREVCALQHLSINTEKSYIHWLVRYGSFLKDPKLKLLTTEMKIEAFLTRLAITGVSASTQNQAFNAILFFYRAVLKQELGPVDSLRAKRPATIRQCPTPTEVHHLLTTVSDNYRYPTRLIVHLLYGCGLRVCEPLNLRIKDVDLRACLKKGGSGGRVPASPNFSAFPVIFGLAGTLALPGLSFQTLTKRRPPLRISGQRQQRPRRALSQVPPGTHRAANGGGEGPGCRRPCQGNSCGSAAVEEVHELAAALGGHAQLVQLLGNGVVRASPKQRRCGAAWPRNGHRSPHLRAGK